MAMYTKMAGSLPVWLLDSKDEITRSKEWENFRDDLYDAIKQQLQESHVENFSDLTDAERLLFVDRATRAISGGNTYNNLFSSVSKSVDRQLNNRVYEQLLEDFPVNTKTDLILDCAQDGIVGLLKKWPEMKSKLHICFNQPLSELLRPLAWRLFLENLNARKQYIQLLATNTKMAISERDREISKKCEEILISETTLETMKGSIGALYAMRAVLSYFHAISGNSEPLADSYYLLMIPFILVAAPDLKRREPASSKVVAILNEEYLTFITTLPSFVKDAINQTYDDKVKAFATNVGQYLQVIKPGAANAIVDAFVPSKEHIVATDAGRNAILSDAAKSLVRPIIRSMFVGHVNREVLLFIWDQYIIGLDSPGFAEDYLAAITAIYLSLLSDKLKSCNSPSRMEICLKTEGHRLTVSQFQYEMKKHFFVDLYNQLKRDERYLMPVLDPTQANYPPWVHWFAPSSIPDRVTTEDRRRAREERDAERKMLLLQRQENLIMKRSTIKNNRRTKRGSSNFRIQDLRQDIENETIEALGAKTREEEDRFLDQQSKRFHDDRLILEDELDKEKRRREDMEKAATEEIERLRREIEALKRQPQRATSASSLHSTISRYLLPPPPSVASRSRPFSKPPSNIPSAAHSKVPSKNPTPIPESPVQPILRNSPVIRPASKAQTPPAKSPTVKTPRQETLAEKKTLDAVLDIVANISNSFKRVANGEGYQQKDLDNHTRDGILEHRNDVKEAEKEVFGHELKPGEFDALPQSTRDEKSHEILDVIRRNMENRRRNELRDGTTR